MTHPTLKQIKGARIAAGLTQAAAAKLVHLGSPSRWAEYESGKRNIDAARWELFNIKVKELK